MTSISSSPHLVPDDVARHTFGSVRRGFDPSEVRAYLESIAVGLRGVAERERQLHQELADAEYRAAHPVLDESALTAALGTETARVLHSAHEAATEIVTKADAESTRILAEAQAEIDAARAETQSHLAELTAAAEAAASDLRERTDRQVAATLDAARNEADDLLARAREECRSMVDEAQGLRARVLADLSRRRKVLHAQIEQLRAGRERLAETVHDVRRSVDAIADELFAAEDNARLAAEAAGRDMAGRPDEGTPEELAAALLAEEAASGDTPPPGGEGDGPTAASTDTADTATTDTDTAPDDTAPDDGTAEATEVSEVATTQADDGSPVDALFAKLRAAQGDADPPAGSEPAASGDGDVPPDAAAQTPAGEGPDADDGAPSDPAPDAPPEDRHPAAVRRDELIDPIVTTLARRLKRNLQDTQNELLDRLRSSNAHWSDTLLPDEREHIDGYATSALPALEEAAAAGAGLARGAGPGDGPPGPSADAVIRIAHDLAEEVVAPLRRRLTDDPAGLVDADEAVVVEHVGSAFREWKGERIERLAADHVVAAFSLGTMAALDGTRLEWVAVAGPGETPCPDCEDNSLSGSQPPGDEFPTGHLHPPAHSGCRCLLTPSAV